MRLHYKKLIRCEFFDSCPSCTGWCLKKKPSAKCVPFLQQAYANTKEARDKQEAKLVKTGIVGDLPVIVGNTHFKKGVKYYQCGSCGMFTTPSHTYCGECGQKLDFSVIFPNKCE